jgi:hypothetical protein
MFSSCRDQFSDAPNMVGQLRFHRGRDAQGLMYTAEIVVNEVDVTIVA